MNIISVFSGAGGLDLGLKSAGHTIVAAIELDIDASNTYKTNNPETVHYNIDIRNFDFKGMSGDCLVGGPPCQGYLGTTKYKEKAINYLYLEYLRALQDIEGLQHFVLENVPQFKYVESAYFFDDFKRGATLAGFDVQACVINMRNYGVLQNRRRLIIYGKKRGVNILDNLETIGLDACELAVKKVLDFNNIQPIITSKANKIYLEENKRELTLDEIKIIQGYPLDYFFYGTNESILRQIGNSVPVKFGRVLGEALKNSEVDYGNKKG